jgi:hypothetical protein
MDYFRAFDAAGEWSRRSPCLTDEAIHLNTGNYIVRLFYLYPILHICT